MLGDIFFDALAGVEHLLLQLPVLLTQLPDPGPLPLPVVFPQLHAGGHGTDKIIAEALMLRVKAPAVIVDHGAVAPIGPAHRFLPGDIELLLGLPTHLLHGRPALAQLPEFCRHGGAVLLNQEAVDPVGHVLGGTAAVDEDAGQAAGCRLPHHKAIGVKGGGERKRSARQYQARI